jgi:hypothetical protein
MKKYETIFYSVLTFIQPHKSETFIQMQNNKESSGKTDNIFIYSKNTTYLAHSVLQT